MFPALQKTSFDSISTCCFDERITNCCDTLFVEEGGNPYFCLYNIRRIDSLAKPLRI